MAIKYKEQRVPFPDSYQNTTLQKYTRNMASLGNSGKKRSKAELSNVCSQVSKTLLLSLQQVKYSIWNLSSSYLNPRLGRSYFQLTESKASWDCIWMSKIQKKENQTTNRVLSVSCFWGFFNSNFTESSNFNKPNNLYILKTYFHI